jgi:hypothetical protein
MLFRISLEENRYKSRNQCRRLRSGWQCTVRPLKLEECSGCRGHHARSACEQNNRIYRTLKLISFAKCASLVFIHTNVTVCLCAAAPALRPAGMTYITVFCVIPNSSDYANMLIRPSGMMPSKYVTI